MPFGLRTRVGLRGHGERGARAYNGALGAEPPAKSRAEPLVRESGDEAPWGSGGEAPLKLKVLTNSDTQRRSKNLLSICQDRLNITMSA